MPFTFNFDAPGTYTIEDNGIVGDGISVVRDQDGNIVTTFANPGDSLEFTVSTAGVNIVVNFTDSLGSASLTIGDLAQAAESPDSIAMRNVVTTGAVTLVSNGTITEGPGSDAAADIVAGTLVMSAVSGIGTGANALEIRAAFLEAETDTGGINIASLGAVTIGALTDLVDGLNVETSGDLRLSAVGTITLGEVDLDTGNPPTPLESVHGGSTSGNVTLIASGASSDIIANTDIDAITAPHGNILLQAGRDVAFGTVGTNFDNDVRASGSVTVNAGRDFLIDGFSDLASDDFGLATGGDVAITAARNIHLRNVTGTDASILANGNSGADVILTTGFNGAVILDAPSGVGIDPLESNSGDITISADKMLFAATTSIRADDGMVTLRGATAGRAVTLGSAGDAALAVELSDTEINRVFASSLTIGADVGGQVRVIAPISLTSTPDLVIRSGTNILVQSNLSVLDQLSLLALDDIFQSAASTITAVSVTAQVDAFDDDVGTGGTAGFNGTLSTSSNLISGNADNDTLNGSAQGNNMLGNGGNDTLRGFGGNDFLNGGIGNDTMVGGLGDDTYFVNVAADQVVEAVGEGRDKVFADLTVSLAANVEDLTIQAVAGAASGNGNNLNNVITGNDSGNSLSGFDGDDTLVGNGGWDNLFGGNNTDLLFGGAGNDNLDGGAGADQMTGGIGDDIYLVDDAGDAVIELVGEGRDKVLANVTHTLAANVDDLTIQAAAGAANGTGNDLANVINGNALANSLSGAGGNDVLAGNAGADNLNGGFGNDTLNGGTEADGYFFTTALGAGNVDIIQGFAPGSDKIVLENSVFTTLAAGALPAAAFRVGAAAGDADDRIIYNSATGAMFYDADGNGAGAAVQFATLSTGLAVAASDFLVI